MAPDRILAEPARVLSQAQRDSYFANGYLLLDRILPEAWVERLRAATAEMVDRSRAVTRSDAVWDLERGHGPERRLRPRPPPARRAIAPRPAMG